MSIFVDAQRLQQDDAWYNEEEERQQKHEIKQLLDRELDNILDDEDLQTPDCSFVQSRIDSHDIDVEKPRFCADAPETSQWMSTPLVVNDILRKDMKFAAFGSNKENTPPELKRSTEAIFKAPPPMDDSESTNMSQGSLGRRGQMSSRSTPSKPDEHERFLGEHDRRGELAVLYKAKCRDVERLATELSDVKDTAEKDSRLLRHQLTLAQADGSRLKTRLDEVEAQLGEVQRENGEVKKVQQAAEKSLRALEQRERDLKKQLDMANCTIESLSDQLKQVNDVAMKAQIQEEHSSYVDRLRKHFESELTVQQDRYDQLCLQFQEKDDEIHALQSELVQINDMRCKDKDMINRLSETLESVQQKYVNLLQEKRSGAASKADIETAEGLRNKLLDYEHQISVFERMINEACQVDFAEDDQLSPIPELDSNSFNEVLTSFQMELSKLIERNRQKRYKVEQLEAELLLRETKISELKSSLKLEQEERYKAAEQAHESSSLCGEVERLNSLLDRKEELIGKLQSELNEKRTELKTASMKFALDRQSLHDEVTAVRSRLLEEQASFGQMAERLHAEVRERERRLQERDARPTAAAAAQTDPAPDRDALRLAADATRLADERDQLAAANRLLAEQLRLARQQLVDREDEFRRTLQAENKALSDSIVALERDIKLQYENEVALLRQALAAKEADSASTEESLQTRLSELRTEMDALYGHVIDKLEAEKQVLEQTAARRGASVASWAQTDQWSPDYEVARTLQQQYMEAAENIRQEVLQYVQNSNGRAARLLRGKVQANCGKLMQVALSRVSNAARLALRQSAPRLPDGHMKVVDEVLVSCFATERDKLNESIQKRPSGQKSHDSSRNSDTDASTHTNSFGTLPLPACLAGPL